IPTPNPTPTLEPSPLPTPPQQGPVIIVPSADQPSPPPPSPSAEQTVFWTIRDAITMALENNVDIAIERKSLRIAEFNILSAEGVYEPVFTATPSYSSAKQPNIGRFSGVASTINSTNTKSLNLNAGLNKLFQTGGGSFQST